MLPARITELKKAAARLGALTALIRAKAWIPDLEEDDIIKGYPGVKEDGSNFNNDDLRRLTKEMRPIASKLAEDTDLSHFQPAYDAEGKSSLPKSMKSKNLCLQSVSILTLLTLTPPALSMKKPSFKL